MTPIDYSKIAARYDKNKARLSSSPDPKLAEYLRQNPKDNYTALDVACGTGNYLAVQNRHFAEFPITWHGLDNSQEMIEIAKTKTSHVQYELHDANTGLPYDTNTFDYVTLNFALHIIEQRKLILEEIYRVLKMGGVFRMRTAAMEQTPNWWLYQYYPQTQWIDAERFWTAQKIFNELESTGFDVQIKIEHVIERKKLSDLHALLVNRDISHLHLISDTAYESGLRQIETELDNDPTASRVNEFALMVCEATRQPGF